MELQAIIQSIQDETNEQVERGGVHAISARLLQLAGMLEILQLQDSVPAILCGAIMAMQADLEHKYKNGFTGTHSYY